MTGGSKPLTGRVYPAKGRTGTPLDALAALNAMVNSVTEFGRVREQERTKRVAVTAYADLERQRIQAASSVLSDYFEKTFAERRNNFDALFTRLDAATEAGDASSMAASLDALVKIAQTSPLADLGDLGQIRKALDDADHVWDL